ncbi:arabinose import ATP-binding protein AraG, partial [Vibrio parahaemolyticus V-223/04]
KETTQSSNVRL